MPLSRRATCCLPDSTPRLGDFQTELMAFPHGRHDDQVDSFSQFLQWAAARSAVCLGLGLVSIRKESSDRMC